MGVTALALFLIMVSSALYAHEADSSADDVRKQLFSGESIISPYRANYVLPAYYSDSPDQLVFEERNPSEEGIRYTEIKFQISIKAHVAKWGPEYNDGLFVAYTQLSYWQAYARSPYFRETNYEPEIFYGLRQSKKILGWDLDEFSAGYVHQSNGAGGEWERSWNRLFVEEVLSRGNLYLDVRAWYSIERSLNENPDIENYLGYGRVVFGLLKGNHEITLKVRNLFESGFSQGAEEINWEFPLYNGVHGLIQIFSGYGQSLSEYNHYTNAIGIGVDLSRLF